MMRRLLGIVVALGLLAALPAAARAQDSIYLTPYIGVADGEFTVGGSATFLTPTIGFEADLAWLGGTEFLTDTDVDVVTFMGGVMYLFETPTIVEPYAAGGVGLIRSTYDGPITGDGSFNSFGLNVGGGAHFFWSENIDARADLRYFRALSGDLGDVDFDFWRFTGGITFKF